MKETNMTAKKLIQEQLTLQKRLDEIDEELETCYVTGALVQIVEDYGVLVTSNDTHLIIGRDGEIFEQAETLKDLILKSENDFEVIDPKFLVTAYKSVKPTTN